MRSLSASIIVAAGLVCFTRAATLITHGDTRLFVMFVLGCVTVIAFLFWLRELQHPLEP